MTYNDFIIEINKAGLNVQRFAALMHMQPNSISNNRKKGVVPVHLAVIASLLAEMTYHDIDYTPIFARLGPDRKKLRGGAKTGKFAGDPQGMLEFDQ